MPAAAPPSASRYYALSSLLARQTAREAVRIRRRGIAAVASLLAGRQMVTASLAEVSVGLMLDDQPGATPAAEAALSPLAFTTAPDNFDAMAANILADADFERLVASIMQDTARSAQQAAVTARPRVAHVRHLTLPSCSRCAVLAGRVYRYSEAFKRHPGCDCVMIPVTVASPDLTYDVAALARNGQVTGLSKADLEALEHGADFNQVVNVRLRSAGLTESGRVLARAGRPTPEALMRDASSRDEALELLTRFGYVR